MTIKTKDAVTNAVSAVTPAQTTTLQNDLQIPTLINQNSLTLSISLQAQVQALSQAVTALSVATISPSRVGPFVDAGVTYADAATYLAALSVKINSSGGTPSAPVKNAAPTVVFPGGTGDVNETPTYTWGTYTGTAVTSRDVQVLVNGIGGPREQLVLGRVGGHVAVHQVVVVLAPVAVQRAGQRQALVVGQVVVGPQGAVVEPALVVARATLGQQIVAPSGKPNPVANEFARPKVGTSAERGSEVEFSFSEIERAIAPGVAVATRGAHPAVQALVHALFQHNVDDASRALAIVLSRRRSDDFD